MDLDSGTLLIVWTGIVAPSTKTWAMVWTRIVALYTKTWAVVPTFPGRPAGTWGHSGGSAQSV